MSQEHIWALDVSWRELERAQQRLHVAELLLRQRELPTLTQGPLPRALLRGR